MTKYKAYPEYKDSGVEWCSKLPLGWKTTNLRWLSNIYAGGTPSKNVFYYWENGTVPWINSGAVNQSYVTEPSTYISKTAFENSSAKWIPKGALVVALAGQGKTKGMVAQLGIDTTCNQSMAAIVFHREYLSRYIFWWLTSNYQNIRNMAGGDLRDGLNLELLGDIQCPQPKDNECNQISAFLDHETAKIDNLIEKQQQLIELLKEKRQAVISHAVTKGLNPDVPMKDSGVEWLGNVPKHWKYGYLRWYISVSSGTYLNNKDFEIDESNDCTHPVIGGNGVMGFTSKKNDGNCLVVGRVGALCGNVHQIRKPCWVTDNALKITFGCDFNVDYLEMYLKVLDLNKLANHNAQPLITGTMIKDQVAIIPPIHEQRNITKFIQSKVGKIDLLLQKSSEAVDKIKERRTALISAAVTGKIDVRNWVAPEAREAEVSQEATV